VEDVGVSETMPAFRLLQWERAPQLVEAPVPQPGPGEVLVEVAGNGLCHSDATMRQMPAALGEALGWNMPFTLGHEVGGWIAALGDGVAGVQVRDAVALVSPSSCGECELCRAGRESACPHGLVGRGYGRDGGLARYVIARAPRDIVKLTTLDPVHAAPLTDAGATTYHAVARVVSKLREGSTAAIIGFGGLGGFAVQLLRALTPARVVAVDPNPVRLDLATELGAHDVMDDARGLPGCDAVLDIVGTDATIAAGLAATKPYGSFGLVGAGNGTFARPWFNGLPRDVDVFTFQGSNIADAHAVIALAEAGRIRSLVDVFPLDRVTQAYEALESGILRGRAVVTP